MSIPKRVFQKTESRKQGTHQEIALWSTKRILKRKKEKFYEVAKKCPLS